MRTWTFHFRYEEAHSSCFPELSRLLGFPRASIRFGLFTCERLATLVRERTRALVSSLTSDLPPLFYDFARCPRASQKELLRAETHKTAAACRAAVRAPAVSVAASSRRRRRSEREDSEGERGRDITLSSVSPDHVEINDVSSTKDACLKRSTLFPALRRSFSLVPASHVAGSVRARCTCAYRLAYKVSENLPLESS